MSSLLKIARLPLKGTFQPLRVRSHPPVSTRSQITLLHGLQEPHRVSCACSINFSTQAKLQKFKSPRNEPSKTRQDAEKGGSEYEDSFSTPSVSLDSLGIGKKMRVFLLAVLTVFGSIETWFWCKAIVIWWKGDESEETE
ncbi:hypothetical protein PENSTE_c001G03659 [Penicillium steckii]|uniref:Uncharacterized protein n=1 Tax=Penicillium steckii TaxID=303698 RepID=A0A1V6U1E5_9EURO|nr:hypothetical protein PENSTE_c001G03659 [Penicillium steckii]